MTTLPPCSGIIVFEIGKYIDQTILVCTPRGHYGFPKGKRNKDETSLDNAWRELQEETGLTKDHVTLIDDFYIDEKSDKGQLSVRYFVGILTKKLKEFKFDKTELDHVIWVNIEKAYILKNLRDRRVEILKMAYEKVQSIQKIK